MPRNPQGLYTLPLPPVVPGELIEANWANPTLDDIASALTGSLPRNGTAPMLAPLTLSNIPPTQPRHAVDVAYVQQFLAYATGMPIGAVFPFSGSVVPAGYLLCDGQAVSRTDYADLFATIGTIYGSGDGATTFNVPDMRDQFVRGKSDSRQIGSTQASAFGAHIHPVSDPGHTHTQLAHDHTLTTSAHGHGVNDPGHLHTAKDLPGGAGAFGSGAGFMLVDQPTSVALTGISIQAAGGLSGNTDSKQPSIVANTTGVAVGATGDAETRPQNIAMNYLIKAKNDSSNVSAIAGLTSSDTNLIAIDNTNPVVPQITPRANIAFGMLQLDANGKASAAQLPAGVQSFLGTFDASGGQNPSQAFPATTFLDGDTYLLSKGGTITVFDPNTNTQAPTVVDLGWNLVYLQNLTQPVGWYYLEAPVVTAAIASQVAFSPAGTISADNVQAAIEELDTETQAGLAVLDASKAAVGNAQPTMDGVANPGVSAAASRQDHVHPTDTSRAPASAATAAGTSFTPGGNISSATVQGAIIELDNEKAPLKLTAAGCAFSVRNSAVSGPLSNGADNDLSIVPETTRFDFGNNETGYVFTAPVDGVYQFTGLVSVNSSSAGLELSEAWFSTDQYAGSLVKEALGAFVYKASGGFSDIASTVSLTLFLSAGKKVKLGVRPLGSGTLTASTIMFSGSLVAAS